ncbi:MAG: glycosyl hydrolase family 65 protein [Candidatus Omnitrophica bacterium]|nr:glycosyl hydrolase family 65 protein [Candidatus Omnitrophota bacterium]
MNKLFKFLNIFSREEKSRSWTLNYNWFKPSQEGLREALCTLGNGYMGVRGAISESKASRVNYPGTYLAGLYNKIGTPIAEKIIYNEAFVNCPNWLLLFFNTGSEWLNPQSKKLLYYDQTLDMRKGILIRKMRIRENNGKITFVEKHRIVSMANPHICAIKYSITPENYEGRVYIKSMLDASLQNWGVTRYRKLNSKHLKALNASIEGKNIMYICAKTTQSNITLCEAARTKVFCNSKMIKTQTPNITTDKKVISQDFSIDVKKKKKYDIEKIVSIYKSNDPGIKDPASKALTEIKKQGDFSELFDEHKKVWENIWKKFYFSIEGDDFSKQALRLHAFHLLQTASLHNQNIDAGIPARGLHGEAYRGHIFWDEMFILHFYDLHEPIISKALLMYRYNRLAAARNYAKDNNYKGAMFPWQSASTGCEETQVLHLNPLSGRWNPDHSCIQRHVSFAIAYNVWKYWERSGDMHFMTKYGLEIILSIAQFGASLCKYSKNDKRYHTEGLMGPDEFHEKLPRAGSPGLRDNSYTNLMIVWTLMHAKKALDMVTKEIASSLIRKLNISKHEISLWDDIAKKINIVINKDGIISQFDGYFKLKELDWDFYRSKYGNIRRMDRILRAEGKSPDEYKVSKQADALMIFYILSLSEVKTIFNQLGYAFDKNILKRNYDYYVERTSHGSTLSKVVHCYIAHVLGRTKEAWTWFEDVLRSDIHDTQGGTTLEGIHAGVMGGSINILFSAFAGIKVLEHKIKIDPALPKKWNSLRTRFLYRGTWISLFIMKDELSLRLRSTKRKKVSIPIEVRGKLYYFVSGKTHKIKLSKDTAMV